VGTLAAILLLLLTGLPLLPVGPHAPAAPPRASPAAGGGGTLLLKQAVDSLAAVTPADPASPWVNLTPFLNRSPSPREGAQIAYNPNDGHVMLFGGLARNRSLGDSWEFFAGHWAPLSPATVPPTRYKAGFVYDSHDNEMVMFGGNYGSGYRNDTWVWNGSNWNQLVLNPSPTPREDLMMSDDAADGYVLLFGGEAPSGALDKDTWTFSNNVWTNITATITIAPPGREAATVTYDAIDQEIVVFSGKIGASGLGKDTWVYHAGVWKNLTASLPASPPARESGMMAYDPIDRMVLLLGGFHFPNTLADEWKFTGNRWTLLTPPSAPNPRQDAAMGFYPNGGFGFIVLFGGRTSPTANATILGDTWSYKPPINVTLSSDVTTLDAGQSVNLTLGVDGGYPPFAAVGWLGLPAGCSDALNASNVTCAPPPGVYNLTGWAIDSGGFNGTSFPWTITVHPDPAVNVSNSSLSGTAPFLVNFTALPSDGTPPYFLNWSFGDGAYDSSVNTSHAYGIGTFYATVHLVDAVGVGASHVVGPISAVPGTSPLTATLTASPVSGVAPLLVQFGVSAAGGTGPYTYFWQFGVPGAAATSASPSYTYPSAGSFAASVTVNDSNGGTLTKSVAIDVAAAQPLTAMAGAVPTSGFAPLTVLFSGSAAGGVAPYSYAWQFGDGSASATGPSPSHTYTSPGWYNATLLATGGDASNASARVPVHVLAPLGVTIAAALGATYCAAGSPVAPVNLTSQVTGGSGSPTYAWTIGASTSTVANPEATVPAGPTNVSLVVTDPSGTSNSTSLVVTVPSTSCAAPSGGSEAPSEWLVIALIVVVGAVIAVEAVLLLRRKK
jgi:PKD repeat protein